jgi:hypothetical protein
MVDPDHRMADLAARVSCPPVAGLATCLETGRGIETFTNVSAGSLSKNNPGVTGRVRERLAMAGGGRDHGGLCA